MDFRVLQTFKPCFSFLSLWQITREKQLEIVLNLRRVYWGSWFPVSWLHDSIASELWPKEYHGKEWSSNRMKPQLLEGKRGNFLLKGPGSRYPCKVMPQWLNPYPLRTTPSLSHHSANVLSVDEIFIVGKIKAPIITD